MPVNVIFPKVSLEMATGRISRWLVQEGEVVREGQLLFEIDNDKAAVEVESPGAGVIRNLVAEGVEVDVGADVARIFAENEVETASTPEVAEVTRPSVPELALASPAPIQAGTRRNRLNATPLARRLAREGDIALEGLTGTGPRGRIQKKDVLAGLASHSPAMPSPVAPRPISPMYEIPQRQVMQAPASHNSLHSAWLRRGTGAPIVMLHGFSGDLNNWRGLLAGRTDFPVLGLDLAGHGQSPRHTPEDLDDLAEWVEATILGQIEGPVLLCGHSFGGALALRLARRARLETRGLCLFAPAGLGPEINTDFTHGILRARTAESLRPWLELLVHDPATISDVFVKAVVTQRQDEQLTAAMSAFANRFFPDGTQVFSVRQDLAALTSLPVRMIFGRQDRILPFRSTLGLPDHVALYAFDNCGHMPHLEKPELALRILSELHRSL